LTIDLSHCVFLVNETVPLTKTDKRTTREHKTAYIQQVRESLDQHDSLYLFRYENMRSNKFKDVRLHFRSDSRLWLGKNKLLQLALGRTPEEEYSDNLRHVAELLVGGNVGLLLTSRPRTDVESYFAHLVEPDYARAGTVTSREVLIRADQLVDLPVSMMEQLRKLGMPVDIKDGKVILRDGLDTWRLCKEGETLSAEKCKLLVHFDVKLADFKVNLVCFWSKGEFEMLE
jgi:mRNA turnover protein 4